MSKKNSQEQVIPHALVGLICVISLRLKTDDHTSRSSSEEWLSYSFSYFLDDNQIDNLSRQKIYELFRILGICWPLFLCLRKYNYTNGKFHLITTYHHYFSLFLHLLFLDLFTKLMLIQFEQYIFLMLKEIFWFEGKIADISTISAQGQGSLNQFIKNTL